MWKKVTGEQFETVKTLVMNGMDINAIDTNTGKSAFYELCYSEPGVTVEMLAFCKQYGADLNSKCHGGYTPFHRICLNDYDKYDMKYNVIRYCVEEMGAKFDIKADSGATAFSLICASMLKIDFPLLQYCVHHGCRFSEMSIDGYTAFHWLCCLSWRNGINLEVVKYCIENGGDLNERNRFGHTPFMWLCYYVSYIANTKIIEYCMTNTNAEVNIANREGKTPMTYLAQYMEENLNKVANKLELLSVID